MENQPELEPHQEALEELLQLFVEWLEELDLEEIGDLTGELIFDFMDRFPLLGNLTGVIDGLLLEIDLLCLEFRSVNLTDFQGLVREVVQVCCCLP